MISPDYSEVFETFWKRMLIERKQMPWMRSLGGKEEAFKEFKLLKIVESDIDYLVNQYKNQGHAIINESKAGKSPAPLKDICRWLKLRRFEDEVGTELVIAPGRNFFDRSWAE